MPPVDISGFFLGGCSTEYNSLRGDGAGYCFCPQPPAWVRRPCCCPSSTRSTLKRISPSDTYAKPSDYRPDSLRPDHDWWGPPCHIQRRAGARIYPEGRG